MTRCIAWVLVLVTAVFARTGSLHAQNAERLFAAGAYRAAADSFAARALEGPGVTAHWFNLGSALYEAGDDVGARVAWTTAARMDPRDRVIRQALGLLPAAEPASATLTYVAPLTPAESTAIAVLAWAVAWTLAALGRRWNVAIVSVGVAIVAGAYTLRTVQRYDRPVGLVRHAGTPVRAAPYRSAPARRAVDDGMAVRIARANGAWLLVERGTERGWLHESEIERLPATHTLGVASR